MKSASQEFASGRVLWTVDGVPLDGHKPASLNECLVLGCANKCNPNRPGSGFCAERHTKTSMEDSHA